MKRLAHHVWRKTRVTRLHTTPGTLPYREEQHLPRLLACAAPLLAGSAIYAFGTAYSDEPASGAVGIAVAITALVLTTMLVLRVSIELIDQRLTFCVRPFYARAIPLDDVVEWREQTEIPQGNLGPDSYVRRLYGADLKVSEGYSAFNIESRHGVELKLSNGSYFFVTSAHPERLMQAICAAKSQAVAR